MLFLVDQCRSVPFVQMWIRLLAGKGFEIGGDKGAWRAKKEKNPPAVVQPVFLSLQMMQMTQTLRFQCVKIGSSYRSWITKHAEFLPLKEGTNFLQADFTLKSTRENCLGYLDSLLRDVNKDHTSSPTPFWHRWLKGTNDLTWATSIVLNQLKTFLFNKSQSFQSCNFVPRGSELLIQVLGRRQSYNFLSPENTVYFSNLIHFMSHWTPGQLGCFF